MNSIKTLIDLALKEDIGKGDITTNLLIPAGHRSVASIIAKEPGVICGLSLLGAIYKKVNRSVRVTLKVKDGARVRPGKVVATIKGQTRAILSAERTTLNFLQRLSGIATLTSQFVSKVKGTDVKILDTRKTAPGWRLLDKYAVKTGGGFNHRLGLYDAFLVKNNHLKTLSIAEALWKIQNFCKQINPQNPLTKFVPIEIEIRNLNEFILALTLLSTVKSAHRVIMLDNMAPEQIREAVVIRNKAGKLIRWETERAILLEASGGVNLGNVRRYAATGVDYISIGALTHSFKALDISMRLDIGSGII